VTTPSSRSQSSGNGGTVAGLTIGQSGSEVRGLDVENFGYAGILITAANAQVSGCFIGTGPTGETAAPSATGLMIQNSSNLIGGPNVDDRNVISANGVGLQYSQFNTLAQNGVIAGNMIGTDVTGQVALGNTGPGIILDNAQSNVIGAAGTKGSTNVIAYNGGEGIDVMGGVQDQISLNSIFNNVGAAIKLSAGANDSVAPPVMTFAPGSADGTLSGTLTDLPNLTYTIQLFSNATAPAVGHEQGQTFAGELMVSTDSSGRGTFSVIKPNRFYTATATEPSGNTSAFAAATTAQALSASQTAVASSANPSTIGQSVTFTAVVTAPSFQGTLTGTITFTIDGQAEAPIPHSRPGRTRSPRPIVATRMSAPAAQLPLPRPSTRRL
jgi:hypothetical protein